MMSKKAPRKMRTYLAWTVGLLAFVTLLTIFTFHSDQQTSLSHVNRRSEKPLQNNTRIFIFFGTRPEIIKMAPLIHALLDDGGFEVVTVFTGQHPDLIRPFLKIFQIKLDIWFHKILVPNQLITDLISKLMIAGRGLESQESDIWMVQGDTSTAFAIATVAFHRGLRIAHVEAGLRTHNMYSPFPEEFNRKTISSIATFHFAPTENNRKNLLNEGIPDERIFVTGNTVIDAVKYLQTNNKTKMPDAMKDISWNSKILVLATLHRGENIEMMSILYSTIRNVTCSNCLFIVPVHPNPNAGKAAKTICQLDPVRFICVPSLSYDEVHWVMKRSQFILTDSGGLQEEATWYHVPTLVLRTSTERMEAVDAGVASLVGQDLNLLKEKMRALTNKSSSLWKSMSKPSYPFGYGNSGKLILGILKSMKIYQTKKLTFVPFISENLRNEHLGKTLRTQIFSPVSIGVVLNVFKRNTLKQQLEDVAKQTLLPSVVIVLRNGNHVNISREIEYFRKHHPRIELQYIASSKNLRFHGRFYLAYLLNTTYVSIWDDDISPKTEWLEYCVEFSKAHGNALVGANGRIFTILSEKGPKQEELRGRRNDFVGHVWTLPREFLKYYISSHKFTLHTGEDIQLSFALQKVGIESWSPKQSGQKAVQEMRVGIDKVSSWRTNQAPRLLLFCKLLRVGFKTLKCKNCQDKRLVENCIRNFKEEAATVEKAAQYNDIVENNDALNYSRAHWGT